MGQPTQNIAAKLNDLLTRVNNLRLAKDIRKPTRFNAHGQAHANRVAQRDQVESVATSGNHQ